MDLSFRHTISPSALDRRAQLSDMLRTMPASERRELYRLAETHS